MFCGDRNFSYLLKDKDVNGTIRPLLAQMVEQWTVVPWVTSSILVERTVPL